MDCRAIDRFVYQSMRHVSALRYIAYTAAQAPVCGESQFMLEQAVLLLLIRYWYYHLTQKVL
jgi:hypothetical protein